MFEICKDSKVVFYGYSQFDTVQFKYQEMYSLGYQVIGYLDQRAEEIAPYINVSCWTKEDFPYSQKERKDVVVILLLQNGRLHEGIAEGLHSYGFEKLLFIPEKIDTLQKKQMVQKYNSFIRSEYTGLTNIPEWDDIFGNSCRENNEFLRYEEQNCTVYVPVELLFTYELEDGGEENICFAKDYQELFSVLEGKTFVCDNYFEFMGADTELKKEKLLSDRYSLYCMWEYYRQHDMEYFIEAAAIVSWNPKGYFTIIDGHHRVMYLMNKGYKKIPVSMTNENYSRWCNHIQKPEYEELKARCIPVPHPAFLQEEYMYSEHWWNVICYLYEIGHHALCRLVEIDDYMGYYAGVYQRIVKGTSAVILDYESEISLCQIMQNCMHQSVPIIKSSEVKFQENDIIYLKYNDDENRFMQLIRKVHGQCMIIDLPEMGSKKLLEQILKEFPGKLKNICKYYRKRVHIICAIERSVVTWQR